MAHNQDLLADIRSAWIYECLGALVAIIVALFWLWSVTPEYKMTMVISPVERSGSADLSAFLPHSEAPAMQYLMQRLGANNGSTEFVRFEQSLVSSKVAQNMAQRKDVMQTVFADERDASNGWQSPGGLTAMLYALSGMDGWAEPDIARLSEYLQDEIRIEPVGATTLRRLVYYHHDAEFGRRLLSALYEATDQIIRQETYQDTDSKIAYLYKRLKQAQNPAHKQALTSLLLEQEQRKLMIEAGTTFAAKIVDGPRSSAIPAWPSPVLVLPGALVFGFVCGFMVFHMRQSRKDTTSDFDD